MSKQDVNDEYLDYYRNTSQFLFNALQMSHPQEAPSNNLASVQFSTDYFLTHWSEVIELLNYAAVHAYHNILREKLLESGIDIGEF